LKNLVILGMGIVCAMYLLNVGAGILDVIPDNFPLVGNLDEATATVLLVSCLAYFGVDLTQLFKKDAKKPPDAKELTR